MALLGDDGRGYELARKLESQGVWRSWIGDDSMYANFVPFLSSPSSWESFMRTDDTKSRAQIQLQLRARALLFDKACVSLFPRSNRSSASNSKLNPNYLQLHGDDVYYTLENPTQNVAQPSKVQSKGSFGVGSRYGVHEDDSLSQRIPESWYSQFFEKYRATKPYRLPSGDRESEKRTPEQMSNYLRFVEKHKRSRAVVLEEQSMGPNNPMFDNGLARISSNLDDDESLFFPETTFSANSVPDSALPPSNQMDNVQNIKYNGVLDNLPPIMTKNPIMLERLGIRPEYMEQTGNHDRGRSGSFALKNNLSSEQAAEMSRKMVSRLLMDVGFDRASGGPLDIFGQLFGSHISKLGRILKILSDGYKKECSAIELLKMFLQTIGHGNLAAFAEVVKDGTKNNVQQQAQMQQVQAMLMQSQLQMQNQTSVRLPHQFPRQMPNQMVHPLQQQQQMVHPLQQQQQQQHWDRMRRRQPSTSRPVINMGGHMNVDNESQSQGQRSMVEVKLENPPEFPMDNNVTSFSTMNYRNPQMQFRQQQFASISAFQAQSNNQFRPMASVQIPQLQQQAHSPNMGMVRAPPVKVEAFQELMGGDSSIKHDPDETKLTSPK